MTNQSELYEQVSAAMYDTDYKHVIEDPEYFDRAAVDAVVEFITADRKRVALEARIDERQMLSFHRAYGRDYQATLETLEEANDDRIAELKAQQEANQ